MVLIVKEEPLVGSFRLSQELNTEHRYIQALLKKYKEDFESFGQLRTPDSLRFKSNESVTTIRKRGGQVREIFLNESQALFLLVLVKNNPKTSDLKKRLIKEFVSQRTFIKNILSQRKDPNWIDTREGGKLARREETDVIKKFVEYAKSQGSESAHLYYTNITKMQNRALFATDFLNQKFENIREVASKFSLTALTVCDRVIAKSLEEEMEKGTPYKDIYFIAKERVETFAKTIGILEVCQAIPGIDIQPEFTPRLGV